MGGSSKEIDFKVALLTREVFDKYSKQDKDEPYITKDDLKEFLLSILNLTGDEDAWDEHKYDKAFM